MLKDRKSGHKIHAVGCFFSSKLLPALVVAQTSLTKRSLNFSSAAGCLHSIMFTGEVACSFYGVVAMF